jgi:hypothetical protein
MKTVPVQFLVDSGSILTLISYNVLMKMCTDIELKLQKSDWQSPGILIIWDQIISPWSHISVWLATWIISLVMFIVWLSI